MRTNITPKKRTVSYLFLLPFFLLFARCESNRFDVDIKNKDINFEVKRYDKDFFAFQNENHETVNQKLTAKYGSFHTLYLTNIMALGHPEDPATKKQIAGFVNNSDISLLTDSVHNQFTNFSPFAQQIETGFKYYQHWFPEKHIPEVITFMGAFNYNVAVTDSVLGIGLEYYLGSDFELYKTAGLPFYKIKKMKPEFLAYDAIRGWLLSEFAQAENQDFLLAAIIEYGKALYLMDAVFPHGEDHLKVGFKKEELNWCAQNEHHIWQSMMNSDMLFSKDQNAIKKYTGEAPFTPGMPEDSPGRVGNWVGWQIVRAYAEKHPELSPEEIVSLTDYKNILSKSKYKPAK